jgi:hypothetical protein
MDKLPAMPSATLVESDRPGKSYQGGIMHLAALMERAAAEQSISRQEWEALLELAAVVGEVLASGEGSSLVRLIALVEGGVVAVEGVPQSEVLRRLSVFV